MHAMTAPLTAHEEQVIALRILEIEDDLRPMLRAAPACSAILKRDDDRVGGTRHAAVERLSDAVDLARETDIEPWLLDQILTTWNEAQTLRWRLALSAEGVALREARRYASSKVSVEDLEQEAVLGLLAAATRFEPGRGVRFAAYARWWVRAQITHTIRLAEAFRISSGALELHRNVRKLVLSDELAGIIRPLSDLADELGVEPQRVHQVMAAIARHVAEDADEGDGRSIIDTLPDDGARTPEEDVVEADAARCLRDTIASRFDERERQILHHRFGIDMEHASTEVVARGLSLSPERVRQVERQCVDTLRAIFQREMDV